MNISTIDVSERDIEIRVRHDLDSPLSSITVSKCGVMIGGKHHPWEKLAPRAPRTDNDHMASNPNDGSKGLHI